VGLWAAKILFVQKAVERADIFEAFFLDNFGTFSQMIVEMVIYGSIYSWKYSNVSLYWV
jgi:hypothetical protein